MSKSAIQSNPTQSLSLALVLHGNESADRGGPTTRSRLIEREARLAGFEVSVVNSVPDLSELPRPDVVHVLNSWPPDSSVKALIAARRLGIPVVFSPIALNLCYAKHFLFAVPQLLEQATDHIHLHQGAAAMQAVTPAWQPGHGAPAAGVARHFEALRAAVALADHVVCLSATEKAFLEAIGARMRDCTIITNGVDANVFCNGRGAEFRSAFGLDRFVLTVGRIEPRKNQALLAAAARQAGVGLVCIGHVANTDYFRLVRRWAPDLFVHIDRIETREDLAAAYAAASVFALPSWSEGAPLSALEAGAAGVPLILSNMSSEREYFSDFARFRHPCDIDNLANDLAEFTEDHSSDRAERSQFVASEYSDSEHARQTIDLYYEALCRRAEEPAPPAGPPARIGKREAAIIDRLMARCRAGYNSWRFTAHGINILALGVTDGQQQNMPLRLQSVSDAAFDAVILDLAPTDRRRQPAVVTQKSVDNSYRRRVRDLVTRGLNALPAYLHHPLKRAIRRVKPKYTGVLGIEHPRPILSCSSWEKTSVTRCGGVRLEISARRETSVVPVPPLIDTGLVAVLGAGDDPGRQINALARIASVHRSSLLVVLLAKEILSHQDLAELPKGIRIVLPPGTTTGYSARVSAHLGQENVLVAQAIDETAIFEALATAVIYLLPEYFQPG